ncbi:chromatin modification-related protein EAF7-like [Thrips palmi]|uniref:Chromatin modification-related protein EAF7-like n=1 Tax=Thrips palmi TaxID=161013 RepID=A0A6P8ZJQ8_THRPL|nr:chromatin modification-related protein EAF7-like [Thrips palmi]
MGRSLNKDSDASVPERRSTRHSKNPEEEVKLSPTGKGKRSIGKKKEEKTENKNEEKTENKSPEKTDNKSTEKAGNKIAEKIGNKNEEENKSQNKEETEPETEDTNDKNHDKKSDTDGNSSNAKPTTSESPNVKPASSRVVRSVRITRKRQLSDEENEDDPEEVDDKNDENTNEKNDGDVDNKEDDKDEDKSETKKDKSEGPPKEKAKKKRKPPTKKKKDVQDESELWTPLEPLDTEERKDSQKKAQSKSDRRKQALVERQAPAEPMLQKQLPRRRRNSDTSECEVLVSVPRHHRKSKTIVTVDIDDEASETGSIQIVAEPDVDSVFDFKRLLIQYRNVNLPSALWGVHKDPRNLFVSFTRFNPDYPDTNGLIVDRAVVFQGTLNPEAFVNGEKIELPEMFNVVETIFEAAQVVQFVNNAVVPVIQPTIEPTDVTC